MAPITSCEPEVWVGDHWIDDAGRDGVVRITMVDPHLRIVETQDEEGGSTATATLEAFLATHQQVRRSALAAEHGWR